MLCKSAVLACLLAVAVYSDIRYYRISNFIAAPAIAAGFIINAVTGGPKGLLAACLAAAAPAVLLMILFALRMMGAGDIKLFSAAGAIMGPHFILYAVVFSFLVGGVMAAAVILLRRNAKSRLSHIAAYLKTVLLCRTLVPYTEFEDKSDGAKFHFSPAIAAGCCIQLSILLL